MPNKQMVQLFQRNGKESIFFLQILFSLEYMHKEKQALLTLVVFLVSLRFCTF